MFKEWHDSKSIWDDPWSHRAGLVNKDSSLVRNVPQKKFQGYQTKTNVSYSIKKRGGGEEVTLENNTCSAQCLQCMFELCEGLRPFSLQTTRASYNSRGGAKHWENFVSFILQIRNSWLRSGTARDEEREEGRWIMDWGKDVKVVGMGWGCRG